MVCEIGVVFDDGTPFPGGAWLGRSLEMANEELAVGKDDLVNLWRLVAGRDGGPAWIKMMEKALPTMTYQAWRRDPQVNGTCQFFSAC